MSGAVRGPINDATVWTRSDLLRRDDWRHELSTAEIADLERALIASKSDGRSMFDVTRDDFPLPVLGASIQRWMQTLQRGAGFLNVKGLPVDRYDPDDIARIHWGIGAHMGTPVSQNAAGDLLSQIRDIGANPMDHSKRLYKTNAELGFHSDGSDLVALLCIRPAKFGGRNRLVSCGALYNELLRRRPDLAPLLYQPFYWDRNEEQGPGQDPFFALPICMSDGSFFRLFYIGWYIRRAQRHAGVPRLSAEQHQLLDLIDQIALEPEMHVEFTLEAGEVNYLKNSAVLHMRTAFEDFDEPERKRHMIRLWLTAHGEWADGDAFVQQGIPVKEGVTSDLDDIAVADGD